MKDQFELNKALFDAVTACCVEETERLLKLGLIAVSGRKDVPGRPMLLVTTDTFLHKFNLTSLDELPQLPQELFETV